MPLALTQPDLDVVDRRILEAIYANKNNKSSTARQLAQLQEELAQPANLEILQGALPGLRSVRVIDINFRNHLESGRYPQLTIWEEAASDRRTKTLLPAPQDLRWVTVFVASALLRSGRYERVNGFDDLSPGELRSLVGELVEWLGEIKDRHTSPGRSPSRTPSEAPPPAASEDQEATAEPATQGGGESALIEKLTSGLRAEWEALPRGLQGHLDQAWAPALFGTLGRLALHDAERRQWILKLNRTPPLEQDAPLGEALRALGDKTAQFGWLPSLPDHRRLQLSILLRLLGRRADQLASLDEDSDALAGFLLDFTEQPAMAAVSGHMPGMQGPDPSALREATG